jgi:hypothetical protein
LAKINGVAAPNQIHPGQELKVVPGPFAAVVDLTRNQLTLTVDGRYAGKFPISVAPGEAIGEGQWIVEQKRPTTPTDRAIVLRKDPAAPITAAAAGPTLVISSVPTTTATVESIINVSAKDAEELSDILSVGSRIVTRR